MLNDARMAGTRPDQQQSRILYADRQAVLRTGLGELQAKLSGEGWQSVERFLKDVGALVRAAPAR
jgi:hypothetical protein